MYLLCKMWMCWVFSICLCISMLHLFLPAVCLGELIIMEWTNQTSWPSDIHLALVKQVTTKGNNRSSILMPLVLSVPGWRLTMLNFFSGCSLLQRQALLSAGNYPFAYRSSDSPLGSFTISCGFFLNLVLPVQVIHFLLWRWNCVLDPYLCGG